MKQGIHPNYVDCTITCACGNVIKTRSTKPEIHVEICSKCHPFYTGKQKLVDTGGRVDRFKRRFGRKQLHPRDLSALSVSGGGGLMCRARSRPCGFVRSGPFLHSCARGREP